MNKHIPNVPSMKTVYTNSNSEVHVTCISIMSVQILVWLLTNCPVCVSVLPLELEAPAQMSQSVNVFVQHTVDRRHVPRHVPVPGEISKEMALL